MRLIAALGCTLLLAGTASAQDPLPERQVVYVVERDLTEMADRDRFDVAHAMIHDGRFADALPLLEANIAESPDAGDIDYSFAWAMVAAAHLCDFDKALRYYRTVATDFAGSLTTGAGGATRTWADQRDVARRAVATCEGGQATAGQMAALDEESRAIELREALDLACRAQAGDQIARWHLPESVWGELIAEGYLKAECD